MDKYNIIKDILFTENQVNDRCTELQNQIFSYYKPILENEDLVSIIVMNGGRCIYTKIMQPITNFKNKINIKLGLVECQSYFDKTESTDTFLMNTDFIEEKIEELKNKHVVIVDDIYDTGKTLFNVKEKITQLLNPKSVEFLVMVERAIKREQYNLDIKFCGFKLEQDHFLIGFGMDYKGQLRHLPYIATMNKENMGKDIICEKVCNNCGATLKVEETGENYGLTNCVVDGGYFSTHLSDCTSYKFDLCEKCLKKMFDKFKFPPEQNEII